MDIMEHEKEHELKVYNLKHKTNEHHAQESHKRNSPIFGNSNLNWGLLILFGVLLLFNLYQVQSLGVMTGNSIHFSYSGYDLSDVDVTQIESTAQGIAVLFPINDIKTTEDAISVIIPTGTPDYGVAMGVSYDDPVTALSLLENAYTTLKKQAQDDPEVWARYLTLAAAPRGISCEYCCGVGPQGVTADGTLKCGCAHNPAVQSITLWLMLNTDYSDAEILREVYLWKSIWFPKNMVGLALQIAGGDTSVLEDLPEMVGGC